MDNLILSTKNIDELISEVAKEVVRQLGQTPTNAEPSEQDDLLSRDEACKFLKIDGSTLWAWTNKGKLKAYAIGSRRYYKRTELIEALTPVKTKP